MKDPNTYDSPEASFSVIPRAHLEESRTESKQAIEHEDAIAEASVELEKEQHESLGLIDAAKSLLLWSESSEERVIQQELNPPEQK